jgi:hypothetical protein
MWPIYRDVIERLFAAQVRPYEAEVIGESLSRVARAARAEGEAQTGASN